LLYRLKYSCAYIGLVSFRGTVNHPDFVRGSPQVITHSLETWTVKEARNCDKADYSSVRRRIVIKNLPCSPTPEINVEVTQVFSMSAAATFHPQPMQVSTAWLIPFLRRPACFETNCQERSLHQISTG
jgi:hypothetical protein